MEHSILTCIPILSRIARYHGKPHEFSLVSESFSETIDSYAYGTWEKMASMKALKKAVKLGLKARVDTISSILEERGKIINWSMLLVLAICSKQTEMSLHIYKKHESIDLDAPTKVSGVIFDFSPYRAAAYHECDELIKLATLNPERIAVLHTLHTNGRNMLCYLYDRIGLTTIVELLVSQPLLSPTDLKFPVQLLKRGMSYREVSRLQEDGLIHVTRYGFWHAVNNLLWEFKKGQSHVIQDGFDLREFFTEETLKLHGSYAH